MQTILIAGCGYVGTTLALRLSRAGHQVWAIRRNTAALPDGIHPIQADLLNLESLRPLPAYFDFVFYTAGAASFDETAYRSAYVDGLWNVLETLEVEGRRPQRVFFTSSTGVYHQNQGEWLEETSPTTPDRFSGQCLLEGEELLQGSMFAGTVVRLGGIYGPGRTRLLDLVRAGQAECVKSRTTYLNLIHRDDAAGILEHLMNLDHPEELYLGVDHEPVERCTLLRWMAAKLRLPAPRMVHEQEQHEPQRGGNRRFLNTRIKKTGYSFQYPTYREGYRELL
ncbi:MAG: SDR family oxidoreductase [Candidatus Hydrogenedentes bacterium]|nr:SDR family oxidoreductase [Candidatus Hydrogenedentota bacterium]